MGGGFRRRHDTPEFQIVEKYIRTNKRHRRALEGELNATGVYRSQHQLLMYVAENPGASQKELARLQHVSTATIAVSLKKLEHGGYLKREVDSKDNRYNQIQITQKGMDVVEKSIQVFDRMEKTMFRGFSQEDFERLGELLDRIYNNLEEYVPAGKKERRREEGAGKEAEESARKETEAGKEAEEANRYPPDDRDAGQRIYENQQKERISK